MLLIRDANIADMDGAYRMIVEAHRGLDEEHSRRLDAALVLILANHIGDATVLAEAVALAREAVGEADQTPVAAQNR